MEQYIRPVFAALFAAISACCFGLLLFNMFRSKEGGRHEHRRRNGPGR